MEDCDRVGKCGMFAEVGDIVQVVKGRKYEKGLKFVVDDFASFNYNGYPGWHDDLRIVFYDYNGKNYIDPMNVEIVAKNEDREFNPEYANVHSVEVLA